MSVAKMNKTKKEITAKDECVKICQAIWSCKNIEQKDGCYKMFETYKKKHGEENIGITFIEIELARLEQLIVKMEERNQKLQALQEQRNKELEAEANKELKEKQVDKKIIPLNTKNKPTE